jgi:hypothetical protein
VAVKSSPVFIACRTTGSLNSSNNSASLTRKLSKTPWDLIKGADLNGFKL